MIQLDDPWLADGQRLLYRRLLDAWACPGTIADLSDRSGGARARLAVLACLCDVASSLHDPHGLIGEGDRSRLGAVPTTAANAAFVVADAAKAPGDLVPARGTLLSPERGATLVLDCQAVGEGPAVRLSGPGVDGVCELRLLGVDPGWWRARAGWCAFPLGVDLVFCDARRVACVPRTARLEV